MTSSSISEKLCIEVKKVHEIDCHQKKPYDILARGTAFTPFQPMYTSLASSITRFDKETFTNPIKSRFQAIDKQLCTQNSINFKEYL